MQKFRFLKHHFLLQKGTGVALGILGFFQIKKMTSAFAVPIFCLLVVINISRKVMENLMLFALHRTGSQVESDVNYRPIRSIRSTLQAKSSDLPESSLHKKTVWSSFTFQKMKRNTFSVIFKSTGLQLSMNDNLLFLFVNNHNLGLIWNPNNISRILCTVGYNIQIQIQHLFRNKYK